MRARVRELESTVASTPIAQNLHGEHVAVYESVHSLDVHGRALLLLTSTYYLYLYKARHIILLFGIPLLRNITLILLIT